MFPLYDDNPIPGRPYVTWTLMAICIGVYLMQLPLTDRELHAFFVSYGMIPVVLFTEMSLPPEVARVPEWLTPATSMFVHGGFMHLAGNMLYLWIFGDNIELSMGRVRYLLFYLLCGLIAAFSNAFLDMNSPIPLIGASGAISGVLGAYLLLYPRANVQVLMFPFGLVGVPALLVLGFWFVMQLFSGFSSSAGEAGVAFWAHIGGFVAGIILVHFFKRSHVGYFAKGHSQPFRRTSKQANSWEDPDNYIQDRPSDPSSDGPSEGPLDGPWGRRPKD